MANTSRSARETARRERVEQLRREQRAKERRRTMTVVAILVGVIVVVVALVAISLIRSGSSSASAPQIIPATPVGTTTIEQQPTRIPNTTGVKGVLAWAANVPPATPNPKALENAHVDGPVKYAVTPPVGGPHNPIWMNAGVYTKPIPSERAVHNLEHGAIWITYRPDLPAREVAELTAFVGRQTLIPEPNAGVAGESNRFMDMSPWATNDLPAPIVLSSWGYQLRVQSPNDPRMQQFVNTFRHVQKYTPEFGAPVDGYPVETSGRAAEFGGTKPNPPGVAPNP